MTIILKAVVICFAIKYTKIRKVVFAIKKRISIFLALLLFLSIFYPCQALISDEMNRRSVKLFCNSIAQLNEKYEFTEDDYEYHYNQNNPNKSVRLCDYS